MSEPGIDPKYIIERQGRRFVLYAGLLDLAHNLGLTSISTRLLQAPSAANDQTAIVHATVAFVGEGPDGPRTFEGLGDANPGNVGKMIAPHVIRMAETRAKARALRDGTNIEMVAVEELGGDDEASPAPRFEPERPPEPPRVVPVGHAARPEEHRLQVPFVMPTNRATGRPFTEKELRLRYRELVDRAEGLGIAHKQLPADAPLGVVADTAKALHGQIKAAELAIPAAT